MFCKNIDVHIAMAAQLIIIPFGQIQRDILNFLRIELSQIFSLDVKIAKTEPIPQYAFDPKRRQYHSTKILEWLKNIPVMDTRILGIVDLDLYVPKLKNSSNINRWKKHATGKDYVPTNWLNGNCE